MFILASSSSRRIALLEQIGRKPARVVAPDIDEAMRPNESPSAYVGRMAREKAEQVAIEYPSTVILSADTVVVKQRKILDKPLVDQSVRAHLEVLSGTRHQVLTNVAVIDAQGKFRRKLVTSLVKFKPLSSQEIDAYVASGEGMGKAGGYAIQGRAGAFVQMIQGSYSAIVGLPLYETTRLLDLALGVNTSEVEEAS